MYFGDFVENIISKSKGIFLHYTDSGDKCCIGIQTHNNKCIQVYWPVLSTRLVKGNGFKTV